MGCACNREQPVVEREQRAGLLARTDDKIGIIRIDTVLSDDLERCIKCDIKKADGYFLILQQGVLCLVFGDAFALQHCGKGISNFPMEREWCDKISACRELNQACLGWLIQDDRKND